MNSPQPVPDLATLNSTAQGRNWARRLVNVLVALVVIAVAGATFVFSYDGVHAIALLGGVSAQLARYYPGLFDAVLVIACVAAVMLRDGRWWARLWAWLVIVIVLGAIGTTDVLHAMNYTLRHRLTEGIVAAAPVAAVLLAFSLLLTLLRQSRTPAPAAPAVPLDLPALPAAVSLAPIALPAAPTVSMAPRLAAAVEPQNAVAEPAATVPVRVAADALAEPQNAVAEPAATVPVPMAAVTVAPLTDPVPLPEGMPTADVAPTRAESVLAEPRDAAQAEAHPETQPTKVIPAAPAAEASTGADEPAPPTVVIPAVTLSREPARPQSIRYAGGDVRDTPPSADYWDTEDAGEFAGLVYPARDDPDDDGDAGDKVDDDGDARDEVDGEGDEVDDDGDGVDDDGDGDAGDDTGADEPARRNPPELDDDAPPFATAPFAPVPRLNRVRSMPAPPADEDE
jgi:hypothetical protein